MTAANAYRMAIDIGGTFTDTVLVHGGSIRATAKTPTTPDKPVFGALTGARDVLKSAGIDWGDVTGFIHGTTLATNALIERRGAKVATITTSGFRDILEIGYERRYSQYAINIEKPDLIVPRQSAFTIKGRMNASGQELTPLDVSTVDGLVRNLEDGGFEALAICLLHSYANPDHERQLVALLQARLPHLVMSQSHEISPEAREFDRLCTTIANAYIQPLMAGYLSDFKARFEAEGLKCPILMMTASGGMTTVETARRLPVRLVESGPAGGAVLAARIAREVNMPEVLSFDMGGTTAKLCLIDDFRPRMARKFEIARTERFIKGSGMPVRIPVVEMIEIGAGGGSIATIDRLGRLRVGPQSAGADPGPAAFNKGGTDPTVTDADVSQGLIDPARFAEGRLSIDPAVAEHALDKSIGPALSLDASHTARGISEIVDENMASAARMHAVESGKDLSNRLMIAFGGNGPLHATRVARRAQISRILVPRDPGVGSAVGFLSAPVSFEIVRSHYIILDKLNIADINRFFRGMVDKAQTVVRSGASDGKANENRIAFMRYHGQGHEIEIELPPRDLISSDIENLKQAFEREYTRQFSRAIPDMKIEILNWSLSISIPIHMDSVTDNILDVEHGAPAETRKILCDVTGHWRSVPVLDRQSLLPDTEIQGPALITEPQSTTFVSADFSAKIDQHGNIWLTQIPKGAT